MGMRLPLFQFDPLPEIKAKDWVHLVLGCDLNEDLSFHSENGHDRNLLQLLRNVTQFVPKQTVKQWKLCQRASTCANVPIMTILRIK